MIGSEGRGSLLEESFLLLFGVATTAREELCTAPQAVVVVVVGGNGSGSSNTNR